MPTPPDPRIDFEDFFGQVIEPNLLDFAAIRETTRKRVVLGRRLKKAMFLTGIAGLGIALLGQGHDVPNWLKLIAFLMILLGIGGWFLSDWIFQEDETRLKDALRATIAHPVAAALGFRLRKLDAPFQDQKFKEILPPYGSGKIGDAIDQKRPDADLWFSDLKLEQGSEEDKREVFIGMIGKISRSTNAKSDILIVPDRGGVRAILSNIIEARPDVAFPNDRRFEEAFDVVSNDPAAARACLSAEARAALLAVRSRHGSERTAFLIKPDGILFSIDNQFDLFELGDALSASDFRELTQRAVRKVDGLGYLVDTLLPLFRGSSHDNSI